MNVLTLHPPDDRRELCFAELIVTAEALHERDGIPQPTARLYGVVDAMRFVAARDLTMFMLVSRRYERACLIVTSNKPFALGARSSGTTSQPPR